MNDQHYPDDAEPINLLTLNTIRELVHLASQANLSELLVERDGTRLHIKCQPAAVASRQSPPAPVPPAATQSPAPTTHHQPHTHVGTHDNLNDDYILKAPLVGVFHSAPAPSGSPFVAVGDTIAAGDTVCLIESLQVMHPVGADIAGQIVRMLVQDGQAVEYGQPLMVLTPADSL